MKKKLLLSFSLFILIMSSCVNKSYTKYDNKDFSIEYPKSWLIEENYYPTMPFFAYSDSQIVKVSTRLLSDVSIDSFVNERIEQFRNIQNGFQLIEKTIDGDNAIIHYMNSDEDLHIGTVMRIVKDNNMFYGFDCSYENDAQKDTVDYIINSFDLK